MIRISGAHGILCLALLVAGCAKTVNTIEIPKEGPQRFVDTDPRLSRVASVTDVRKGRAGDLLRIQVDVTNLTSSEQTIYYRFAWIDADGLTVEGPLSSWQHAILQGGQLITLNGVAPLQNITDCRVQLQRDESR